MKILTTSFLTCAVKSCRFSPLSFPLHFRDAQLLRSDIEYNPLLLRNLLPRLDLDALETSVRELGLEKMMPERMLLERIAEGGAGRSNEESNETTEEAEEGEEGDAEMKDTANGADTSIHGSSTTTTKNGASVDEDKEAILKKLHALLIETSVQEGKLVCGNCGFEYPIKEGVGNFLLPSHLV